MVSLNIINTREYNVLIGTVMIEHVLTVKFALPRMMRPRSINCVGSQKSPTTSFCGLTYSLHSCAVAGGTRIPERVRACRGRHPQSRIGRNIILYQSSQRQVFRMTSCMEISSLTLTKMGMPCSGPLSFPCWRSLSSSTARETSWKLGGREMTALHLAPWVLCVSI